MRPTYLCVQALLLIGNILQNDMQPQAAWTLLGMTIRAAQGLGLHKTGDDQSPQRLLWYADYSRD